MTFQVSFDPELPDHGSASLPNEVNWEFVYGASNDQPDRNLRYVVCGTLVCYYPASLATLLGDLLIEREALQSGRAHDVSMSGYTLLLAEVTGHSVTFRDPGPDGDLVGEVPVADVRIALENACARLWAHLVAPSPATT